MHTAGRVHVARVFRIWGDLEIAHGHFQDPETAQSSRDGWAVSGFRAISRWAKGVFRILKRPSVGTFSVSPSVSDVHQL